jgi:hypothetical protein
VRENENRSEKKRKWEVKGKNAKKGRIKAKRGKYHFRRGGDKYRFRIKK